MKMINNDKLYLDYIVPSKLSRPDAVGSLDVKEKLKLKSFPSGHFA